MQRNLEDFGDEFDEEIHPLPPYNTYEFISDYKWFSSVIIALLAIASIYLFIKFKYYRNNSENSYKNILENGMFDFSLLQKIKRLSNVRKASSNLDFSSNKSSGNMDSDDEIVSNDTDNVDGCIDENTTKSPLKTQSAANANDANREFTKDEKSEEEGVQNEEENIVDNRKDGLNDSDIPFTNMKSNVIGEFRNKAKDIENSMTAEQWQEEYAVRAQQLESIFALMMEDKTKYGLESKEELLEQMKLYADSTILTDKD